VQAPSPAIGGENIFQPIIVDLTSGFAARFGDVECGYRTNSIPACPEASQVFAGAVPDRRNDSETSDQDALFFLHFGYSVS
jgi:hypothetical protein